MSVPLLDTLTADYARFPQNQTYDIYAADVYFKDPMTSFTGIDRYRSMIDLMTTWFRDAALELHHIEQRDDRITTTWTLTWTTPLPWNPRIAISGQSEMQVKDDKITSHIDRWDCSRWAVVQQHFPWN
jgi:Uncharacterized conserved protein (DUF2358)